MQVQGQTFSTVWQHVLGFYPIACNLINFHRVCHPGVTHECMYVCMYVCMSVPGTVTQNWVWCWQIACLVATPQYWLLRMQG